MNYFSAIQIGICAYESLEKNRSGEVVGITSKGVFLKLADQSILFLSQEKFGNPLTINLEPVLQTPSLNVGESFKIAKGLIQFEHSPVVIQTQSAAIWSSKKLANPMLVLPNPSDAIAFLLSLRTRLAQPVLLLDEVLAVSGLSPAYHSSDSEVHSMLQSLKNHALSSPAKCFAPIRFFAGRGRGLTPSGDDLLLGWIYTLGCWKEKPELDFPQLQQVLRQAVENRTTAISRNLIEAAMQGEIDQRLLQAFEMMVGVQPMDFSIIQNVLEWGSSSGIEVCAGMGLGLLTLSNLPG
ncbi:MAG: DUF2877 domain-containing protein [Chloroflexota bacterium]